jgi:hypothetical protein
MKILKSKKVLLISSLIYMALTFLLPIDKTGFNPSIGFKATDAFLSEYGEYIVFGMTLIVAIIISMESNIGKFLNKLISIKWIHIASYFIMIVALVLFIFGIPGLWWSWITIGSFLVMILVTPVILENKIPKIDALLLGAGVAYFIMAVWEIPYLYGLWKYWEKPQGMPFHNIFISIEFYLPIIAIGLFTAVLIVMKNSKILKKNIHIKLSIIFFAITIIGYAIWFIVGFPCNPYCDIKTGVWVATPFNYNINLLVRLTKVTANLSFLSLIGFWNFKRTN